MRENHLALNILVVDDEIAILSLIETCLAVDDHNVTTAKSLLQATQIMRGTSFDLFIVDLGLGDGSGLDLVEQIRAAHPSWIIILSGRSDPIDRVLGLEVGADDYINKPFHVRELRSRVRAAERRMNSGKEDADEIRKPLEGFERLRLNLSKRYVETATGGIIHLTAQEFSVVQFLFENKNIAHSRDTIMREALGGQQGRSTRLVDTLIRRIRIKLFPDGTGLQWIKTVQGKGYQIVSRDNH